MNKLGASVLHPMELFKSGTSILLVAILFSFSLFLSDRPAPDLILTVAPHHPLSIPCRVLKRISARPAAMPISSAGAGTISFF